jgi:hypothetical protein
MRKFVLTLALLGIFAAATKVSAQDDLNPMLDYLYTSPSFNALFRFNINDELQKVYFSTGNIWSEYEIVEDAYQGEGKGWIYKIKDGIGNIYVVKRASLEGNLTISPIKGKVVTLTRKKYGEGGN